MKKTPIIAIVTTLLMILAILTGCSEKPTTDPTKENSKTEQPQSTVSGSKETEATTPVKPSVGSVINSKEAFLAKAEELLDLSLYEELYANEDNSRNRSYSYDMDSDN